MLDFEKSVILQFFFFKITHSIIIPVSVAPKGVGHIYSKGSWLPLVATTLVVDVMAVHSLSSPGGTALVRAHAVAMVAPVVYLSAVPLQPLSVCR